MSAPNYPALLYFTLEERNKGLALVAKMCDAVECAKPLGYVCAGGLLLSGKHGKEGTHDAPLTPNDLRELANYVERLQAGNDILASDDVRAA